MWRENNQTHKHSRSTNFMIKVISLFEKPTDTNGVYVNTTSRSSDDWSLQLSPFYLGPCDLYAGFTAKKMENAWQYSKVYDCHLDENGDPSFEYFKWAYEGWKKPFGVRYPMGKGAIPKYSFWDNQKYDYISARKNIYAPLYAKAVVQTNAYKQLLEISQSDKNLYLMDFDAYKHQELNMTLTDVMNNPKKKMGHAFVLMMLLTKDVALSI